MNEITKELVFAYCENAKQNAVKLGAVQSVEFDGEGIFVEGDGSAEGCVKAYFLDFTKISQSFGLQQIVRMFRSISETAEGTTVVFVHSFEQKQIERLASLCGFRVYEHFSITRVVKELCAETESEEISYCMAVKKL